MGSHRLVGVQMHAFLQSSTPEAASIPKTYQEHYKEEGMTAEMANSYKTKKEFGTRWVSDEFAICITYTYECIREAVIYVLAEFVR